VIGVITTDFRSPGCGEYRNAFPIRETVPELMQNADVPLPLTPESGLVVSVERVQFFTGKGALQNLLERFYLWHAELPHCDRGIQRRDDSGMPRRMAPFKAFRGSIPREILSCVSDPNYNNKISNVKLQLKMYRRFQFGIFKTRLGEFTV
jgi:hypothetical protein